MAICNMWMKILWMSKGHPSAKIWNRNKLRKLL